MSETVRKCPLCQHELNNLFDISQFRGYEVQNRICNNCGLVFQSPRMSSEELERFYESEYRQIYQGEEDPSEQDLLTQEGRASALLEFIVAPITGINRHLDIGCSAGILLETVLKHYGNHAVGVEPGDAYRSFAQEKGLTIYADVAELEKTDDNKYDLISLAHVLEHISDPVGYLTDLREKYLTSDGWVLIEVPNLYCHDSFEVAHLVNFSSHTLRQTIQQSGFETIKLKIHGRPRSELLGLYVTLLARSGKQTLFIQPERNVALKRQLGMFQRRVYQKLFPKRAWLS